MAPHPDVGPAVAALGLPDAALEGVPGALGIRLGRLGLAEQLAQVEEVLLAGARSDSVTLFHLAMNSCGVIGDSFFGDGCRSIGLIVATVAEITSQIPATTLLASVEPCSEPDIDPPRDLFGHHAARQRGAMFKTRRCPDQTAPRIVNTAPRWRAAWWRSSGFLGGFIAGLEHRPTLASSVVTQGRVPRKVTSDSVPRICESASTPVCRQFRAKPGSYFGLRCYESLGQRPPTSGTPMARGIRGAAACSPRRRRRWFPSRRPTARCGRVSTTTCPAG